MEARKKRKRQKESMLGKEQGAERETGREEGK